jgi:hypothetical protein
VTSRRSISPQTRAQVRERANQLCEYCHTSEQWQYSLFTIDHVIPLAKGGADTRDNLALACSHCNRRKGDLISAIDPVSQAEVMLFNPRTSGWAEHFCWSDDRLRVVGITTTGRATVQALDMNRPRVVRIRLQDMVVGRHPPKGDPIAES